MRSEELGIVSKENFALDPDILCVSHSLETFTTGASQESRWPSSRPSSDTRCLANSRPVSQKQFLFPRRLRPAQGS